MEQNIVDALLAGIDFFDPSMAKFVMYPVAGAIVVSLRESLAAPLTRITILSQLEGNHNHRKDELEGLEEIDLTSNNFGYRLSYFGITSLLHSCFKPLFPESMPPGQVFLMSGALSALTASVIILPFKTSTNYKEFTATFRDIRSLFLKAKPGVVWMTLGIHLYELMMISDFDTDHVVHTRPRVMLDLTWAVIASVAPEILKFLQRKREQIGRIVDGFLRSEFGYRLAYCGTTSLANSCFKILFDLDNMSSCPLFFIIGALSAYTTCIILSPFRAIKTNKGYAATFRDIWRDGGRDLPPTTFDDFPWMTLGISLYEGCFRWSPCSRPGRVYQLSRVMTDLKWAGIATLVNTIHQILTGFEPGLEFAEEWFSLNSKDMWRGNVVSILHSLTYCGVNSFAYLNLRSFLTAFVSSSCPKLVAFTSGALASLAASLVSHPLDTLITHITFEGKDHDDATWKTTLDNLCTKDGGLPSQLYAGISASLLGIVPYMAVSYIACEAVSLLCGRTSPPVNELPSESTSFMFDLARTSIATLTASTVVYPLEVVRRKMQMKRATVNNNRSVSLLKTFKRVVRKEGVEGLYRGVESHLLKVVAGHAFAFTAFELLKR